MEELLNADAYADEGCAGGDHLVVHLVEAASAQLLHAPAEAADAREDHAGGLTDQVTVSGEASVGPEVLERLLGRAEVADLVVEHGDERYRRLPKSDHALGGRHPAALDPDGVAQAAGHALEAGLDDVVGVLSLAQADVQRDACRVGEALPEVLGHLGVERRVAEGQHLSDRHVVGDVRAPREVEGRSEEHTSELQSLMRISYAVFCLKKKKRTKI